jgi:Protein of unknown function (DUF2752)
MKHFFLYLRLFLFVAIPIVLLILPAEYFDEGQSLCLSVLLFDQECLGCGLTRGCMHLIHFDFGGAWYYNAGSFVAFPILAFLWAKWFLADVKIFRNA